MIVLAVDPGITTGWALLTEDGEILKTGTLGVGDADVFRSLEEIIRTMHHQKQTVEMAIEEFPPQRGALGAQLALVVAKVDLAWQTYDLRTRKFTPGEWKTSAVGLSGLPPGMPRISQHEKDAIRIGRYYLSRRRLKK